MKTFSAKPQDVVTNWWIIDATGLTLGRLSSELAKRLQGKHKPTYTPHINTGDVFIIINADKIALTADKANKKVYYHHTQYPGGLKETSFKVMLAKSPRRVIELAVSRMLPKGPLGRRMLKNLKVYSSHEQHPHAAQQPQPFVFDQSMMGG